MDAVKEQVINFARIMFLDNKKKFIVPVKHIKYSRQDEMFIAPAHDNDFDKNHKYYVKYFLCSEDIEPCMENHEHEYFYYAACILALSVIIAEMEKDSTSRIRCPNSKYFSTSDSDNVLIKPISQSSKTERISQKKSRATATKERGLNVLNKINQNAYAPEIFVDQENNGSELWQLPQSSFQSNPSSILNNNSILQSKSRSNDRCTSRSRSRNREENNFISANESDSYSDSELSRMWENLPHDSITNNIYNSTSEIDSNLQRDNNKQSKDSQINKSRSGATHNFPSTSNGNCRPLLGDKALVYSHSTLQSQYHSSELEIRDSTNECNLSDRNRPPLRESDLAANPTHAEVPANRLQGNCSNRIGRKTMKRIPDILLQCIDYYISGLGVADAKRRGEVGKEDNMRYLGEGISISNKRWEMINSRTKPSLFLIDLAMNLWTASELSNRTLHAHVKVKAIPNRSPVKLIEKEKLRLLISLYYDYLNSKKDMRSSEKTRWLLDTTYVLRNKIYKLKEEEINRSRRRTNPHSAQQSLDIHHNVIEIFQEQNGLDDIVSMRLNRNRSLNKARCVRYRQRKKEAQQSIRYKETIIDEDCFKLHRESSKEHIEQSVIQIIHLRNDVQGVLDRTQSNDSTQRINYKRILSKERSRRYREKKRQEINQVQQAMLTESVDENQRLAAKKALDRARHLRFREKKKRDQRLQCQKENDNERLPDAGNEA